MEQYGDRWAPVLVAWTETRQVPELAGHVVGLGGATYVTWEDQRRYVSGQVYLDTADLVGGRGSAVRASVRAVVLHEFGHLLGLAHVQDQSAIMYPETQLRVTDYGSGDRRGLHELSLGDCAPQL